MPNSAAEALAPSPLIGRCVCGGTGPFKRYLPPAPAEQIESELCSCGVAHQVTHLSRDEYEGQYRGEYHRGNIRPGVPYADRYEHDRTIAAIRLETYLRVLRWQGPPATALDVGCANGAFVDQLRSVGVDAAGVDPDPVPAPREHIYAGSVRDALPGAKFQLITYHDVLEHVVDPVAEVREAVSRLAAGPSAIVLDVPNVADPRGLHHYKLEHIWYFTTEALCSMLHRAGIIRVITYKPIPGKIVAIGVRI